ncbi:unnamed protein product [Mytilus coruscus]|uniref:Uncharacterized protein n=1 Tax=Mytilus coruscus TaxID=42192 RepID=A0A6J8E6N4_MYTCO|nr:unnamed protein product [Mytilus coruscus]
MFSSYCDYEEGFKNIHVKGKLQKSLNFWQNIGASNFIFDVIENGYKIPMRNEPDSTTGLGVAETSDICTLHSQKVKTDLINSGFVPNKDKCNWNPSQDIDWLGFHWDLKLGKLSVPNKKLCDIVQLCYLLQTGSRVKIRDLVGFCVIDSRAKTAVSKYAYGFKRFLAWAQKYPEIDSIIPASELYVSLYLQHLMQTVKHFSSVETAFYSIKWAHKLVNLADPCETDLVRSVVESSKRILNKPVQKKEPIDTTTIKTLFNRFCNPRTLRDFRLLSFLYGFIRRILEI